MFKYTFFDYSLLDKVENDCVVQIQLVDAPTWNLNRRVSLNDMKANPRCVQHGGFTPIQKKCQITQICWPSKTGQQFTLP